MKKCGACDNGFAPKEATINCSACKKPHHYDCTGLSEDEFDVMASKKTKLKWFCRLCSDHVSDILTNFEKFKKMNAEIQSIRNDIDKRFLDIEVRLKSCEKIEKNPNITSTIEKVVKDTIPSMNNNEENALIEKKKCNMIYFHIPESDDENVAERIKHDYERFVDLYGSDTARKEDIDNIYRVGKKSTDPRPLVIKFTDTDTKQKYCKLTFGKDLTLRWENEIIKVAATHDRTPKQREKRRELKVQLKEMEDSGIKDIGIRNNRIVTNFQAATSGTRTNWASIVQNLS